MLSDHNLPDINSTRALELVKKWRLGAPFIVITGTLKEEHAAEILSTGAMDYFTKDNLERLPSVIQSLFV